VCEGDQSNDTAKGRFRIRINAQGTVTTFDWPRVDDQTLRDDIYWSRNSQVLVGLTFNGASIGVAASLGGEPIRDAGTATLPSPVFSNNFNFDTLMLSGADSSVTTFRWFGGKAIAGSALPILDPNGIEGQFKSLEFLTTS
jgi:hypothetical protein